MPGSQSQSFIQGMKSVSALEAIKVGPMDTETTLEGGDLFLIQPFSAKSFAAPGTVGPSLIKIASVELLHQGLHASS
jgi:hypothetical protein